MNVWEWVCVIFLKNVMHKSFILLEVEIINEIKLDDYFIDKDWLSVKLLMLNLEKLKLHLTRPKIIKTLKQQPPHRQWVVEDIRRSRESIQVSYFNHPSPKMLIGWKTNGEMWCINKFASPLLHFSRSSSAVWENNREWFYLYVCRWCLS